MKIPYARFAKGEEKWHSVSFDPVDVPKTFYLGLDFHATATKGVYVGMDKGLKRSHLLGAIVSYGLRSATASNRN